MGKSWFLLLSVVYVSSLVAGPIQYVESGQLSGTLGSTVLTNAAFVFTFNGDTANISGTDPLLNLALSDTITIGASNGSFTQAVEVGDSNSNSVVGFSDTARFEGITLQSAGAATYNLATSVGPLTAATANFFGNGGPLSTSLGTLTITGAQDLSFTASTAPEPSSAGLLALGLLAVVVAVRYSKTPVAADKVEALLNRNSSRRAR